MRVHYPIVTATGIKVTRWTARSLAAIGILICGFATVDMLFEGGHQSPSLPFALQGAAFGTHAQSTQLGMLTLGVGFALALVGCILAFRWERMAARLLLASGVVQAFLWAMWLPDRTAPSYSHWDQLTMFSLPPLIIAILLWVVSRSPNETQESAEGETSTSSLTRK